MDCPNCHAANPPDARYCGSCGTTLQRQQPTTGCPSCSQQDVADRLFCPRCEQFLNGPRGIRAAGLGRRFGAWLLEFVLFIVTLAIGYVIWWVIAMGRGQTPGKQVVGIRVMRADGTPSKWGWTFIREFVIKGIVVGLLGQALGPIPAIIDYLWAFWDKDRQTLHDKVMKTVVVDDRVQRYAAEVATAPAF
ncbi:MAG: RDD family protein [Chloroflexi bacterium]|nr:RDD family protein [Chloroflexota bacterium]